jgi:NNP family nitrate/nitrite transporter-like MFS transporter
MNESHASPGPTLASRSDGGGRVLVLSTVSFTLLFAVWLMFGVLAVPIKAELHLTKIQFSWLAATAVLSGSLFRLPFGILADRVGGRRVFVALLLWTAVPTFLVARAESYGALLGYALLFGVAGNAFSAGIAWNAAWADRQKQGFALGVFGAGNVGASVTKLFGPALISLVPAAGIAGGLIPGGWRSVPVVYCILLVVCAFLLWSTSPAPDRMPGSHRTLGSMFAPLAQPRVWRFGLYYVVVFGAYVALSLWLPNYYVSVFHLSLARAALLTAFFIFPASLLRPLGGWLSDRFGPRVVTYAVFILMLATSVILSMPRSVLDLRLPFFVLCVEGLGVGMGVGKASVYKYVPEYFPRDIGAAGGLVGSLGALGGFLLPLGFGYLDSASGHPESCFWLMTVLVLTCLVWLHTVVTRLNRASRATARASLAPSPVLNS